MGERKNLGQKEVPPCRNGPNLSKFPGFPQELPGKFRLPSLRRVFPE